MDMANNNPELFGWIISLLMIFVLPLMIFVYLRHTQPDMEWKRSTAFYFGWFPSNLISCWYLHYSIGFFNSLMILVVCQIVQFMFIILLAHIWIDMFGFRSCE